MTSPQQPGPPPPPPGSVPPYTYQQPEYNPIYAQQHVVPTSTHPAGKASFIIGITIFGLIIINMILSFAGWGYGSMWLQFGVGGILVVGIILWLAALLGLILGIRGTNQKGYFKGLAIVGIVINSLLVLFLAIYTIWAIYLLALFGAFSSGL